MQLPKHVRLFLIVIPLFALITLVSLIGPRLLFNRDKEFRAQAEAGQPIVRAIEEFKKVSGNYPDSLSELVPNYLPAVPDLPDPTQQKFSGWDYTKTTNANEVSYRLRYYMGEGGVEYQPPTWVGNDKGYKSVLLSNQ